MKKPVTIENVHIGTLFFQPEYAKPDNVLMEVVGIEYNDNAGEPVKDMWGGTVWEEPFAVLKAKNTVTGEVSGFTVQSKDSDLSVWLTFVRSKEEYEKLTATKTWACTVKVTCELPAYLSLDDVCNKLRNKIYNGHYTMGKITEVKG